MSPRAAADRATLNQLPETDATGPVPEANQPGHHPPVESDKPTTVPDAYRVDAPTPARGPAVAPGRHRFAFEPLLVPFSLAVGVTPVTAWVELTDDDLEVRFGPWLLRTPLDNVVDAEVTGPYAFVKVAGPPHLSFKDGGVTFATNRQRGVCITFAEPVPAIAPRGLLRHPGATVTVADPEGLADDLRAAAA